MRGVRVWGLILIGTKVARSAGPTVPTPGTEKYRPSETGPRWTSPRPGIGPSPVVGRIGSPGRMARATVRRPPRLIDAISALEFVDASPALRSRPARAGPRRP